MIDSFLKPMLPTLADTVPAGEEWVYEIKYDGFRCILYWNPPDLIMTSRNGCQLQNLFPEIPAFLQTVEKKIETCFPVLLDGELCILEAPSKANFEQIQKRGRLERMDKIKKAAIDHPSSFCAFDLLAIKGDYINNLPFSKRKEMLSELFETMNLNTKEPDRNGRLNFIPYSKDLQSINKKVVEMNGEGIVAKRLNSRWQKGLRTKQWIKMKNLKKGCFFLTGYDTENDFFHAGVLREGSIYSIGLFTHGFSPQEKEALVQIAKANHSGKKGSLIVLEPSLCVELSFLELYKEQLRQPRFIRFRLDVEWEACTWESLQKNS
jgi:DNA ligase D